MTDLYANLGPATVVRAAYHANNAPTTPNQPSSTSSETPHARPDRPLVRDP